jgi:uncharacterized protein (DUF736 family)
MGLMATASSVTKDKGGRYEGELRALSVRAQNNIVSVFDKTSRDQPDYSIFSQCVEITGGWICTGQISGVTLSISVLNWVVGGLLVTIGWSRDCSSPSWTIRASLRQQPTRRPRKVPTLYPVAATPMGSSASGVPHPREQPI